MTYEQRSVSPGPTWAVLTQPASSSSPSTRMSVHSDIDNDTDEDSVDLDLEPGDEDKDEDDHTHAVQAPISISKRKAPATDSETSGGSVFGRDKPHKMPRLDLGAAAASSGVQDAGRGFNGSSPPPTRGIEPRPKDVDTVPVPRDLPPVPDDVDLSLRRRPPSEPPVPGDIVLDPRSSLFSVDSDVDGGASRAQPSGTRERLGLQSVASIRVGASRVESRASSGTSSSSSEFGKTLSHTVQKVFARDKERERAKERARARKQEIMQERRDGAGSLRRGPPVTARKQTASVKNIRVSTASLLKDAQNPNNPRNESAPWTRIKRKRKQIRTSYEEEMARARPLDMARRRSGDMLELTDSSDSTRHPRPSAMTGPRASALANKDDPIIITSGSEDGQLLAIRPTQRRKSGPGGTQANRLRVPPPVNVEVISISDSEEEEFGERGAGVARPAASTSSVNRPSQGAPAAPPPPPEPAIARTPAPIPASAPPSILQDTRQEDAELPPPSPSYGPSPDDFDDPFHLDFDTTGDDARPDGALEGWDVGPSLATLPVVISSCVANAGASAGVPEGGEDVSEPDALFDSYVNMDQLGGDTDQGTGEGALPGGGGDGVGGAVESGAANDLGTSTRDRCDGAGVGPSTSGSGDSANVDGDGDVRMQNLEEGEVDPNDAAPVPSMRTPDTPESGEIRSQGSRLGPTSSGEVRTAEGESPSAGSAAPSHVSPSPSPVLAKLAPTSTLAHLPVASSVSSSLSPSSEIPRWAASQPLGRTRTLVMPDISSYKGVRFKRPPPEPRENPFFSRALNGAARSAKAPVSMGERSASGGVPTPVPVEVGEVQSRDADTDMQDEAAASVPEAVVPMPTPLPQAPLPDTQSSTSTTQASPSTVELSTTATDGPPASASAPSPPPFSQAMTSLQPPPATQPLARSSSRPFIAPSRVPRTSAPMSLVDALNEVRRERLEAFREQGELARGRNVVDPIAGEDPTASMAALSNSAVKGPVEAPPSQPSTPTPTSSRSQSTKAIGHMPSLNDIRMLLARRNVSGSQPGRSVHGSTSTSTPARTSCEDENSHVPVVPVAVPAPRSTDGNDRLVSSLEGASMQKGATARRREVSFAPFKAFISPVQSLGRNVKHSHDDHDHEKEKSGDKGKGREIIHPDHAADASVSPTVARFRTDGSVSLLGSQRPKARESRHRRRESASMAFEAYIMRDLHKQTSVTCVASTAMDPRTGTGTDDVRLQPGIKPPVLPQLPQVPRFSESGSVSVSVASSVASPVISDVVPLTAQAPVVVPMSDVGGDGRPAYDTNGMDVDAEDDRVDATHVDDGVVLVEGAIGEPEMTGEAEGTDEADALLELASVHLSQEELEVVVLDEADKVGDMEVIDEPAAPFGEKPAREAGGVMVVDGPSEDLGMSRGDGEETVPVLVLDDAPSRSSQTEMEPVRTNVVADGPPVDVAMSRGDEEETAPQTVLDDALNLPSQTEENVPAEDLDATVSEEPLAVAENAIASLREVASEERVVQDADAIGISSHMSTPDLVLPEEPDSSSSVERPSTSKDADQHGVHDHGRKRRGPVGDADSMDECDAILSVRAGCESESEEVAAPGSSTASSKTASSTSLALARSRSRSSHSSSKLRSISRAASSADLVDFRPRPPAPVPERTLCGYRILTWTSHVAAERERLPEYRLAKDIPHSLQDSMNTLPASFRNSDVARQIFEAHIREAMTNEPLAPSIEIFDNGIGEEATPPWEFHYTNEIWHGEGVPPPDVKKLESCGCVGRCNPKSGKCACAQKQLRWVQAYIDAEIVPPTWPGSPFVYDHKGLLQRLECPIFECNQFCACDEDCPNRVVQNGRKWPVHIAKTVHKGWGVFAGNKKIPKGAYIGIYAGELLTEQEGEARGRYYDMYGRTYLFSIDFHHLKLGMESPDDWENLYVVDAYHAGNFTRFLNHSCDPNCKIFACYIGDADVDKPLLTVFTTREVEPWEELCFSYYGDIDEKREEIEAAREGGGDVAREHAVYAQCRCEAGNCIGRLFG